MAYRMACQSADLIAGIASLAGATFLDPSRCAPSQPVNILHIHGTADDIGSLRWRRRSRPAGAFAGEYACVSRRAADGPVLGRV